MIVSEDIRGHLCECMEKEKDDTVNLWNNSTVDGKVEYKGKVFSI